MSSKLEQLKAAFAKTKSETNEGGNSKFFQFWRAPVDTTTLFRFLPDADEQNPFGFLVENVIHELWINGTKKRVPCIYEMHGEDCPICQHSRELYAEGKKLEEEGRLDEAKAKNAEGKKFYKIRSWIGQGIVLESPVEHDQEQIVKLVDFGTQIHKAIQAAFRSGDLEKEPYDFFEGYNFRFIKSANGEKASYTTSSFAPKSSALDENVIAKIELFDLKDQRQRYMSATELETLLLAATNSPQQTTTASIPSYTTTTTESAPSQSVAEEAPAPSGGVSNQSVVEQLRARARAKAAETAES